MARSRRESEQFGEVVLPEAELEPLESTQARPRERPNPLLDRNHSAGRERDWLADLPPNVDIRRLRRVRKRVLRTALRESSASRDLAELPGPRESLHCIMRGNYDGYDLVAAVIALEASPLMELHIATLGFNQRNGASLVRLIDGTDPRPFVRLVVSVYHEAHEQEPTKALREQLEARGCELHAVRSHAKVIAFRFASAHYTIESSANLRSCRMVEQFAVHEGEDLFQFHRDWMTALCRGAGA